MTLATQMDNDFDATYDTGEFAESITYTPSGGAATTVVAFVDRDSPLQEAYVRGPETAHCTIRVRKSQVATPARGDTFTIDSATWEMDEMGAQVATRVGAAVYEWLIGLWRID